MSNEVVAIGKGLKVICTKPPKGMGKVANQTVELIETVLAALNYTGEWYIVFRRQVSKREEFKFQLLRREGQGIMVRTKPGDNGTCWEVLILPPRGLLLHGIYEDFRSVHPKKLFLPSPTRNQPDKRGFIKKPIGLVGLPSLASIPMTASGTEDIVIANTRPPEEPQVVNPPEPKPTPKPAPVPIAPIAVPVPVTPVPVAESEKEESEIESGLKLNPELIGSTPLHESPSAVERGLIALGIVVNEADGHVLRPVAMGTLIDTLDLLNLVNKHPGYQEPHKAASSITKGLVSAGYFTRWHCRPSKRGGRVRETTKGYLITPYGREKLEELRKTNPDTNKYPQDIFDKLYTGIGDVEYDDLEEELDEITPAAAAKTPVETKPVQPVQPEQAMDKISARMSDLTPLVQRHDEILGLLKDYDTEIERSKREKANQDDLMVALVKKIALLKVKMVELQQEIDGVQSEIVKHDQRKIQLDNDILEYEGMKRLDIEERDKILGQIRTIMQ